MALRGHRPVAIESCNIYSGGELPALDVFASESVVVSRCRVEARPRPQFLEPSGLASEPALFVESSTAYLYDSLIVGSIGLGGECGNVSSCGSPAKAGDGVAIVTGVLKARSSGIAGGYGPNGIDIWECEEYYAGGMGASSGDGLNIVGTSMAEVTATGIYGGPLDLGSCAAVSAGEAVVGLGGDFVEASGLARRTVVPSTVTEGRPFEIQIVGGPGELVLLALSAGRGLGQGFRSVVGELHLVAPLELVALGTVADSGRLVVPVTASQIDSGARSIGMQPLFVTAAGDVILEGPMTLVVLDSLP